LCQVCIFLFFPVVDKIPNKQRGPFGLDLEGRRLNKAKREICTLCLTLNIECPLQTRSEPIFIACPTYPLYLYWNVTVLGAYYLDMMIIVFPNPILDCSIMAQLDPSGPYLGYHWKRLCWERSHLLVMGGLRDGPSSFL